MNTTGRKVTKGITIAVLCALGAWLVWIKAQGPGPLLYQGRTIRNWTAQLANADKKRRDEAAAALGQLGTNAISDLVGMLHTYDPAWLSAARRLASGTNSFPGQKWLRKISSSDAAVTRCLGARGLSTLGTNADGALSELNRALGDTEPAVRSEAVGALKEIGSAAVPHLAQALEQSDSHVRVYAADVLGRMGPGAALAVPALTRTLQDKDPTVRAQAAIALRRIGRQAAAAVPALIQNLEDGDPVARMNAQMALMEIESASVWSLARLISKGDAEAQRSAAKILVQHYRSIRVAGVALRRMAQSEETASRRIAIESLGAMRFHDEQTLAVLRSCLHDPAAEVRQAATNALAPMLEDK